MLEWISQACDISLLIVSLAYLFSFIIVVCKFASEFGGSAETSQEVHSQKHWWRQFEQEKVLTDM